MLREGLRLASADRLARRARSGAGRSRCRAGRENAARTARSTGWAGTTTRTTSAIPGYGYPVVLSGDDTFDAPASQLYMYSAASGAASGTTRASCTRSSPTTRRSTTTATYPASTAASGHFIEVPRAIATGKTGRGDLGGLRYPRPTDFDPYPSRLPGMPDGPQWVLEHWSQRQQRAPVHPHRGHRLRPARTARRVYFADTGEPRAIPDAGRAGCAAGLRARVALLNGRHLQDGARTRPTRSGRRELSILLERESTPGLRQRGRAAPARQRRDDREQHSTSRRIPARTTPSRPCQATNARIWRYRLPTGARRSVAEVNQSL